MTKAEAKEYILNGYKEYISNLSLDCAILGYHDQQLKVLLVRYEGHKQWGLPGGPIRHQEAISQAANRIAEETTGLYNMFLQQVYAFGDSKYRSENRSKAELLWMIQDVNDGIEINDDNWLLTRQISIGYYALVDYENVSVKTSLFEEYRWCDIDKVPELLFDHNDIIKKTLQTLRLHIYHQPIGINLLPAKFTLPEIHFLYESLLGKSLDRRNFAKKLFALGLLNKLDERKSIGAHRSPNLYEFNVTNYEKALQEGIVLVM